MFSHRSDLFLTIFNIICFGPLVNPLFLLPLNKSIDINGIFKPDNQMITFPEYCASEFPNSFVSAVLNITPLLEFSLKPQEEEATKRQTASGFLPPLICGMWLTGWLWFMITLLYCTSYFDSGIYDSKLENLWCLTTGEKFWLYRLWFMITLLYYTLKC